MRVRTKCVARMGKRSSRGTRQRRGCRRQLLTAILGLKDGMQPARRKLLPGKWGPLCCFLGCSLSWRQLRLARRSVAARAALPRAPWPPARPPPSPRASWARWRISTCAMRLHSLPKSYESMSRAARSHSTLRVGAICRVIFFAHLPPLLHILTAPVFFRLFFCTVACCRPECAAPS